MKSPSFALMGGTDLRLGSHTRPGARVARVRGWRIANDGRCRRNRRASRHSVLTLHEASLARVIEG
jgi:hypothetical protein